MKSSPTWPPLMAFIAATLVSRVDAQDCSPESAYFSLENETAINGFTRSCTTLVGYAYLKTNFTETFVLPNLTSVVDGTIELSNNNVVKSIEFPDLEYLDSLYATGFSQLGRISMPKLRTANHMSFQLHGQEVILDLPSLVNATSILMRGNWTSVEFPKLRAVNGSFTIYQADESPYQAFPGETPMNVSLPVLKQVHDRFEIGGNIASFSAPMLARVSTQHFGQKYGGGIRFEHVGEPLNVSFPQLTATTGLVVRGNLSDVVLPLLQDEVRGIQVFSETPLSINWPIEDGGDTTITGPINSVHFPRMKTFNSIRIRSDRVVDCGALKTEIEQTAGTIGENQTFDCSADHASGLSTGAKAGIGIGVGVGGILLIALGYVLWKRRATTRTSK